MTIPLHAAKTKPTDGGASFPFQHRLQRLVWNVTWLVLASWTPRQMHPWRRFLLRLFGARMARMSDVRGGARIWYPANLEMHPFTSIADGVNCYNMAKITICERALVSQGAFLCGGDHDVNDPTFQLVTKPIVIGKMAWIASEAFVGPGTVVAEGAVLGARAVAVGKSLEAYTIYVGNPARPVGKRKVGPA